MPRMQEPLKKLRDYGEDPTTKRLASLTKTHNIYFIEGDKVEKGKTLRRFMGYMEVIPKIGETVSFDMEHKFEVKNVEYSYKFGLGRPTIYIFIAAK